MGWNHQLDYNYMDLEKCFGREWWCELDYSIWMTMLSRWVIQITHLEYNYKQSFLIQNACPAKDAMRQNLQVVELQEWKRSKRLRIKLDGGCKKGGQGVTYRLTFASTIQLYCMFSIYFFHFCIFSIQLFSPNQRGVSLCVFAMLGDGESQKSDGCGGCLVDGSWSTREIRSRSDSEMPSHRVKLGRFFFLRRMSHR